MPFQAYNHMLIVNQPIRNVQADGTVVGYEFQLQYPSYRGTFLSCLEELELQVDDHPLDKANTLFLLNGKQFLLDELPECFKEYWFVMDYATIRVINPGGLPEGRHKLQARLRHRIPYTGYFGQYMELEANECRELPVIE